MYEELIRIAQKATKEWENDHNFYQAGSLLNSLCEAIAALQAENAEIQKENGCLQHNVTAMQATLDQQAKNCEELLAEKDKEIARVGAKRDTANERGEYYRGKADEEIKIRLKYGKELKRVTAERDKLMDRAHEAQVERDCARAERDALRDSIAEFIVENAECLKIAIDTQDRHYLEVLIAQWRGAQGEA